MCGHVRELLLPYAPPLNVVPYSVPSMLVSPARFISVGSFTETVQHVLLAARCKAKYDAIAVSAAEFGSTIELVADEGHT